MLCCFISDVHANLEALVATFQQIASLPVRRLYCLGDIVGYSADPDACVEMVLSKAEKAVRGNHDKAVAGLMPLDWFNPVAGEAVRWTQRTARSDTLHAIASLAEGPIDVGDGILICHGTPMDEDRYMTDLESMEESFGFLHKRYPRARVCFYGHTHVPMIVRRAGTRGKISVLPAMEEVRLEEGSTYLVNPGSVGQPRDGNTMASFGILETETHAYRTVRVAYGITEAQRKIIDAGLPRELARRIGEGW